MRLDSIVNRERSFTLYGSIVGTAIAYVILLCLHLMVAPIPSEVAVLAWSAPSIAFSGLTILLWFGPSLLIRLSRLTN
jgi:hypothetical protein